MYTITWYVARILYKMAGELLPEYLSGLLAEHHQWIGIPGEVGHICTSTAPRGLYFTVYVKIRLPIFFPLIKPVAASVPEPPGAATFREEPIFCWSEPEPPF